MSSLIQRIGKTVHRMGSTFWRIRDISRRVTRAFQVVQLCLRRWRSGVLGGRVASKVVKLHLRWGSCI